VSGSKKAQPKNGAAASRRKPVRLRPEALASDVIWLTGEEAERFCTTGEISERVEKWAHQEGSSGARASRVSSRAR
jgi:hypothetical protein